MPWVDHLFFYSQMNQSEAAVLVASQMQKLEIRNQENQGVKAVFSFWLRVKTVGSTETHSQDKSAETGTNI